MTPEVSKIENISLYVDLEGKIVNGSLLKVEAANWTSYLF